MASEQFSLCWDNFHKNMSTGMNSLLEGEDLVDVTLAIEGKFLKAHKMVLSICSPYFKELFKSNPCQHPIVFMKDVSYVAIRDLLQFMYQGEVQVSQDNLPTFIKTAEALQIKGLTGDGNSTDAESEVAQEKLNSSDSIPQTTTSSYKATPRPKKQAAAPIMTATPTAKKPRLSVSSSDSHSNPLPPVSKSEPSNTSTAMDNSSVHFKMEPYEQSQAVTVPDDGDETFGDETMDENVADETEDYSLMEGDEPQAGTSTDGTGEGQERTTIYIETPRPGKHPKLIVDENFFVRHRAQTTRGGITIRWRCTNVFRTKCKAVVYTTLQDGSPIKYLYEHNHPNNADQWDKQRMIARQFTVLRPMQTCKRGPVKQAGHVRATKRKRTKRNAVIAQQTDAEAAKEVPEEEVEDEDEEEAVVEEASVEEEEGGEPSSLELGQQNKEMTVHIEGHEQPIYIKVIDEIAEQACKESDAP